MEKSKKEKEKSEKMKLREKKKNTRNGNVPYKVALWKSLGKNRRDKKSEPRRIFLSCFTVYFPSIILGAPTHLLTEALSVCRSQKKKKTIEIA